MAEATVISFSYKEIAEMMIKKQEIHEGIWGVFFRFGIQGANVAFGSPDILPVAIVPVVEIGLQRMDEINNLSVDAAIVNPKPST